MLKDILKMWFVIVSLIGVIALTIWCWNWCDATVIKDYTMSLIAKTAVGAIVPATGGWFWFMYFYWITTTLGIER